MLARGKSDTTKRATNAINTSPRGHTSLSRSLYGSLTAKQARNAPHRGELLKTRQKRVRRIRGVGMTKRRSKHARMRGSTQQLPAVAPHHPRAWRSRSNEDSHQQPLRTLAFTDKKQQKHRHDHESANKRAKNPTTNINTQSEGNHTQHQGNNAHKIRKTEIGLTILSGIKPTTIRPRNTITQHPKSH